MVENVQQIAGTMDAFMGKLMRPENRTIYLIASISENDTASEVVSSVASCWPWSSAFSDLLEDAYL